MSVAPEDSEGDHEQQPHEKLASSALRAPALLCLAALVGVAVVVHLAVIFSTPIVRTSGDEASYTREAHRHIDEGVAQLLPGRMLFHHRPPFGIPLTREVDSRMRSFLILPRSTPSIPA